MEAYDGMIHDAKLLCSESENCECTKDEKNVEQFKEEIEKLFALENLPIMQWMLLPRYIVRCNNENIENDFGTICKISRITQIYGWDLFRRRQYVDFEDQLRYDRSVMESICIESGNE